MLTQRQIHFIEEYLACGVGSRAAVAAGYSEKTARSIASELIRKPAVRKELDRRRKELRAASNFQSLKVLQHAAAMAFASWGDLFDAEGRPLRGDELDPETRIAIQAIRRPLKRRPGAGSFVSTPYRLHPKLASLKLLAQLAGAIPAQPGRPRGPAKKRKQKSNDGIAAIQKRGS